MQRIKMRKRLTLWFVVITMLLDSIGFGVIMPILPNLIEEVGHANVATAARIGGFLMFIFGFMQFIFGPFIGNLSDAYGRRPVLLVSLAGLVIDFIIMAMAPNLAWLVFGRILGGITSATYATANAVVADISDEDEKGANFGLMGAAFGVGMVLGPLLGAVLSVYGTRAPFWGAAVISATNLVFGYFVFRESLPKANRRKFDWRRANPVGSFWELQKKPALWAFAAIFFFYNLAFSAFPTIWNFFTISRFEFEPWKIGVTFAMFGVFMAFSQGVLMGTANARLGARKIVLYGLMIDVAVFIALAFFQDWRWLFLILPISAIATMTGPAFQDLVTRLVDQNEQGELQGILAAVTSLSVLVGTILMSQSFAYFNAPSRAWRFDGMPFVISAASALVALLIYYYRVMHRRDVQAALEASSKRNEKKRKAGKRPKTPKPVQPKHN